MARPRLSIAEVFGLSPLALRVREALVTFRGDGFTPPSRFDRTSLRILKPGLSFPLWLGRRAAGRLVPIYNLFSYERPDPREGWSVRVTSARDFLGTQLTYDSHNGTDFAVPPGTRVVAAAPGRVLRVSSEFDRGGLKVFIDHGAGLITTSNHLARALVAPGETVRRGDVIALSGMSGIDGLLTFPLSTPHVHYNVWLDGEYVDPFGANGVTPLWRNGNWPTPLRGAAPADDARFEPTEWDPDAVERAIGHCLHREVRAQLERESDLSSRAMAVLFQMNYYPTRFDARPALYAQTHARTPRLDLPFTADDFDGVWFPHGVNPPA